MFTISDKYKVLRKAKNERGQKVWRYANIDPNLRPIKDILVEIWLLKKKIDVATGRYANKIMMDK